MSLLWKRDAVRLRPGYGPRRRVLGDGGPAHGAAVGCPGFLLLGKAPHSETDHVPAQRCAACRTVTIAYDPE